MMADAIVPVRHFFVDEAGDLTLFDRRGRVIVGTPGVSHTFIVGVCELQNPDAVSESLEKLRQELLLDSWFQKVPSMSPGAGKTALAFHAKDDVQEVRREVFRLLPSFGAKMIVGIRRKRTLTDLAIKSWRTTGAKLKPDPVYDGLVAKGFRGLLHRAEENRIVFARRGKADRNTALTIALLEAKAAFNRRWGTDHDKPVVVSSGVPSSYAGLQVADYLLWALQRMVERGEDRYFGLVAPCFRLIMDLDDQRRKGYGEWYKDRNPLTLEKLMPVAPG